jgi:polyhydroxybutyrate depolymerase
VTRLRLALSCLAVTVTACSRADLVVITPADGGGTVTCPPSVLPPGDSMQTVQVGSITRSYLLHVPPAYDGSKPVPLIVDFHSLAFSGAMQRDRSTFPVQTDPEGAIMAFPTGLPGPAGNAWDVGPCCVANVDDVGFAMALVAQVKTMACIDARQVYASGFSMGGGMAHFVACHAANVFAAVAPASFDLLQDNVDGCQPPRPITVVAFRGAADTLVPYDGGYSLVVPGMPVTFLGAQATFQKWAAIDQCTGAPSAPDGNGCSMYSNCSGGVEVVLCTKQGAGEIQADASIAWPILKRHSLL